MEEVMTVWQITKVGKSGPYVSTVSVSEKCLLLLFKCTWNRYECNFSRESPLRRPGYIQKCIFLSASENSENSNIRRLQGHVTSRWFSGRQIFNLGWQKWWQRHIRFLIMVQLTQKPSFGRTKHKFCWNLACSIWRMSLIMSGFAIWSRSRPDRTVRAFVRVWLRSWRCPSNFGSYWVNLKLSRGQAAMKEINAEFNDPANKLRTRQLFEIVQTYGRTP